MKAKHALLVLFLSATAASGLALAGDAEQGDQGGHKERGERSQMMGNRMHDPEQMVGRMTRWLELDDNQQQEVSNIMMVASPQLEALTDREKVNRMALYTLDANDPDYSVRMQDLAADNGAIASELTIVMAEMRSNINAVLTPEQQQKLADGAGRMREHVKGRQSSREEGQRAPETDEGQTL
jgi:Spy/CpxP family protein refolding chaperone